jgi:23S rRNA pseudouridine2605 synthase
VTVQGRPVSPRERQVYIVLNKPKDTITTVHDEKGRGTVMGFINTRERIFPVGRLDRNTTGVLLLTTDGELANRLMHPRYGVEKSYRVTCDSPVRQEHLRQLQAGVDIDGVRTMPAHLVVLPGGKGQEIGVTIHEGRNRQVRRMFEFLGYTVEKLDRVAYGPITREGLGRGESRSLTRREVDELYRLAGLDRGW